MKAELRVMYPLDQVTRLDLDGVESVKRTGVHPHPGHSALVWEEGRLVGTVTPRDVEQALRSPAVFRNHTYGSHAPESRG